MGNHICGRDPSPQCVSRMPGRPQALERKEERSILSRFNSGSTVDEGTKGEQCQGLSQEMFSAFIQVMVSDTYDHRLSGEWGRMKGSDMRYKYFCRQECK